MFYVSGEEGQLVLHGSGRDEGVCHAQAGFECVFFQILIAECNPMLRPAIVDPGLSELFLYAAKRTARQHCSRCCRHTSSDIRKYPRRIEYVAVAIFHCGVFRRARPPCRASRNGTEAVPYRGRGFEATFHY
jgi:hypothetical protein